ncbi:MAG: hypothetical protein Q7S74_01690 [Nanoarchaeota archaeon]|nr:hypothetical protein [Nanoarchaeota archaeon]
MNEHRIVQYTFEEEHSQAYRQLLLKTYKEFNYSQAFADLKSKLKNPQNPFFQFGEIQNFIAYSNSAPVGHLSAIIDPRLRTVDNKQIGLIGFYESNEDFSVSKELFDSALQYLKLKNCNAIRGPIDLTIWHPYRFAFDQNPNSVFNFEPMNHKFYPAQFLQLGFKEASKYSSLKRGDLETMLEYSKRVSEPLSEAGYTIHKASPENFLQASRTVHELSNKIFRENWSFVPLSFDEFSFLYGQNSNIENHAILELLKEPCGETIGFALGIPDLITNSLVLKTIGILPEKKSTWGGILLGESQINWAKKLGFDSIIFALRKDEKVTKNVIYNNSARIREYSAFELNLDS